VELTVLGCSGSYGAAHSVACSGYLVRSGPTSIWLDCGNGTLGNLQQHLAAEELTAVVITHAHPDHCADLYGLHVLMKWGLGREGFPVYGPPGLEARLGTLVSEWGNAFAWHELDDGLHLQIGALALDFLRTDHPLPTYAVDISGEGKRLVYTADTGPGWSVSAFAPGADLVLSEASYLDRAKLSQIHLSAKEAGAAARAAGARRLMVTHLWPRLDPDEVQREASDAYGDAVMMATPHVTTVL
jgi:ribonuclease BN (tRNA processing enzyme)